MSIPSSLPVLILIFFITILMVMSRGYLGALIITYTIIMIIVE